MLWGGKAYTKLGARGTPDPAEVVLGGRNTLAAPADVVHVRWARLMPYFWEGDPERAGVPVDSNGGSRPQLAGVVVDSVSLGEPGSGGWDKRKSEQANTHRFR